MITSVIIRPANKEDQPGISSLISTENYVNRHLDWRNPLDWLGYQSYWVLESKGQILAALAITADPEWVAWVRLFSTSSNLHPLDTWKLLFEKAVQYFTQKPHVVIAALAMHNWFFDILIKTTFSHHQDIVVLKWENQILDKPHIASNTSVREMLPADFERVLTIDQISFESLWQFSMESLILAYRQSAYSTVVLQSERVVGFQISTANQSNAHLARIAIHPVEQKHNYGSILVHDMLQFFNKRNFHSITVNTQHDNHASLSLYAKSGFVFTGDTYPVFIYNPTNP